MHQGANLATAQNSIGWAMERGETEGERTSWKKKRKTKFIFPTKHFPISYSSVCHFNSQMATDGMFLITSLPCLNLSVALNTLRKKSKLFKMVSKSLHTWS